ncbi:hypothetical protein [Cellulomonas fengjieae]|uniref:Uncharacterized protein n=1 Tax=Cellulomonas fengjieae TaxID=2819978 RepID=A0ABS3SIT9_9CELL|nr:hypothetical protein [Cellulomonas fengjieae]MBO3085660.1 hypothetical protein [Cellulomonas fengjieae]MBO3102769.1 hypothetical protein [Cellulomonas fengjieae]QVI67625.1 hypothetical protein KG102_08755 [Cellulomonas fengjieae]
MSDPMPDPDLVPDAPDSTELDDREQSPDAILLGEDERETDDAAVGSIEPPD